MAGADRASALQPELICIGEPMVELNQTRAGDPHYLFGHGGDTSNAAIAAARQGAKVGYLTALGQDAFGQSFISLWQQEGVDSSRVRRLADAHTAVYFVTHGPKGHEFSYLRSGSAASRIGPDDVPRDYVAGARGSCTPAASARRSAPRPAMPCCMRSRSRAMRGCWSLTTPTCGSGCGRWRAPGRSATPPPRWPISPCPASTTPRR